MQIQFPFPRDTIAQNIPLPRLDNNFPALYLIPISFPHILPCPAPIISPILLDTAGTAIMSFLAAQASATGLEVGGDQRDPATWRAVLVKHSWKCEDWDLPDRVKDWPTGILLYPGEKGISVASREAESGGVWHRVHFERYGIAFFGTFIAFHLATRS